MSGTERKEEEGKRKEERKKEKGERREFKGKEKKRKEKKEANEWSDRVVRRHVNRLIKLLKIYLYRVYKNRLARKGKNKKKKDVRER